MKRRILTPVDDDDDYDPYYAGSARATIQVNNFTCGRCMRAINSAWEDFILTSENNVITVVHMKCPIKIDESIKEDMEDPFFCGVDK